MTPGRWQPIAHHPRRPLVLCFDCGASEVNESNLLRRQGWQETIAVPRMFRCGDCGKADR